MKSELDEIAFYYLFLDSVVFSQGILTISLNQAAIEPEKRDQKISQSTSIKNLRAITVQDESLGFKVCFTDALYYQVIGESANDFSEDGVFEDGNIVTFTESSLTRYLKDRTLLYDVTSNSEAIVHYCVKTADEWIHVCSREQPVVSRKAT